MVKRFFSFLSVAIVTLVLSTTATQASWLLENDSYVSINLSWLDVTFVDNSSFENAPVGGISVLAPGLTLGTKFNDYVSAEFRLGVGIEDDSVEAANVDNFFGGYLRVGRSVNNSFYPYAIVGFTRLKASWEVTTTTPDECNDSVIPIIGDFIDDVTDVFTGCEVRETTTSTGVEESETEFSPSFGIGFIKEDSASAWNWGFEVMQYISSDKFGDVWGVTLNTTYSF